MMTVDQYRSRARFAQAAADCARDEVMRAEWQVMARGWLRLALMADDQSALAVSLAASRPG